MAEPRRRTGLPPELGVAALVVAASFPLGRLFRTGEIGSVALASAAGSTAVAWGLRRMRAPTGLSVAGSFAAFLWFASVAFFRDAMLGPLPTPRSLTLIWEAMVEGVRRSQSDAAPVSASVSFLALSSFAIWATAWLADDAASKLRHPILAIGVTVPMFVLPGTILEGSRRWIDAGAYLAAALWVLFQDERFRLSRWGRVVGSGAPGWRPGPAARLGFLAIFLALLGTPLLPGFSAPPALRGLTGGGGRTTLNPLISIKPQLSNRARTEVFLVRSRVASYWRLTSLDRFDGLTWTGGPQRAELRLGGRSIAAQNPAPRASLVEQRYEIRDLGGPWLPVAYEPIRIDGIAGVGADRETRTVISSRDLRSGLEYTVRSRIPVLTFEDLDRAPPATDPAMQRYLLLPQSAEMVRVASIARGIVAQAKATTDTPFRQAVALQDHLRGFVYDEDVALNHKIEDIEAFLTDIKRGYCEQFAASMAVMARTLGLPSRVAIGFGVGGPGSSPDEYLVTSRQAHAWVEIFLSGFGWVTFEPTPRADSVVRPPYTTPQTVAPSPTATPTSGEEPTASPSASATTRSGEFEEDPQNLPGGSRRGVLVPVGIVAGAIVLLLSLAFPVAMRIRRRHRYLRARSGHERVSARYLDFLDWCSAAGLGRSSGETPLEHARRLAEPSSDARANLDRLARMATNAVYAPPNGLDPSDAERLSAEARRSLAEHLPRSTRVLTALGWGWWRTDPESGAVLGRRIRTLD